MPENDMRTSFDLEDYYFCLEAYRRWGVRECRELPEQVTRQRKAEFLRLMKKAVDNELDETSRAILYKRFFENKKVQTIGDEMGIDKSTVSRKIKSSLETLREKLKYAYEYRFSGELTPAVIIPYFRDKKEYVTLGQRLRSIRKSQCLTAEEAARDTGIPAERLTMIESGSALPDVKTLAALAQYYKVSTDRILFGRTRVIRGEDGLPETVIT